MKSVQKFGSLLLAALMILSLTACGSKTNNTPAQTPSNGTPTENTPAESRTMPPREMRTIPPPAARCWWSITPPAATPSA